MPIETTINFDDSEVREFLAGLKARMEDTRPLMAILGEVGLTSIQRNFEVGGRPARWKRLADATIKQRQKQNKWPGKILVRKGFSGGMLGDINYKATRDKVVWNSHKIYGAIQHFGGQAGKNKSSTIPARPYMLLQEQDLNEMKNSVLDYVMGI